MWVGISAFDLEVEAVFTLSVFVADARSRVQLAPQIWGKFVELGLMRCSDIDFEPNVDLTGRDLKLRQVVHNR